MIKIGVVGAGGMGTVHMSNYAHIDGCQVTAVCDPSEAAAAKAAEIGATHYTSLTHMLAEAKPDVVDVCTPTFLHKQQVMEALEAGCHVIVEKPVALAVADAQAMFDKAREKGVQLFVAQVLRFTKESQVLRELVETAVYGKVLDACFLRLSGCPRWIQNGWLFDKTKSGLLPFDLHIHDLDFIVSLFGAPQQHSYTSCGSPENSYKEHYRFTYQYEGFNVSAEAAWFQADFPFTATWRVYFERAVVVFDGTTVTAYQFDCPPKVFDTTETIKIPTGINIPPTGIFLEELSHFMQCVKENRPSDVVKEAQILQVLTLLNAIEA